MADKYKDTIFDSSVLFEVPVKKSKSKDYFFKMPFKEVGYISLWNMFLLIFFYLIITSFWIWLYKQHFVLTSLFTLINVFFSIVILLRDPLSWKNTLDMLQILYKYMKKKNIALFIGKKSDLFSRNQREN